MAAPAPLARPDEEELWSTDSKICSRTRSTLVKRELLPERRRDSNGEEIVDTFIKDVFNIEALALKVLSSKLKINVPRVLDSGLDENGLAFIETELWPGIPGTPVKEECRMRDGEKHVDTGECTICHDKAWANADNYIANVVLPDFEKLTSNNTMGPDDDEIVPPPGVRTSAEIGFRPEDIMFEPGTLDVIGIYDWEYHLNSIILPALTGLFP